ncbi:MAG TPA: TatD family hydrolase, partial [Ilumatobacteraceae bacterium]|nr:TatD family hydrolase [Ilumatobacteraceae bacterium]
CHLPDARIPGGADAAVAAGREAGVVQMVSVGCDRDSSLAALDAADRFGNVFATVGLHPHDATHGVASIADLFARPGVIAVGECGLDYHYDHSPRDVQRAAFAEQVV